MTSAPSGLVIAAAASGSGKSTLTAGILRALSAKGVKVQPFKCGPDYIDPGFHAAASGKRSFNLDAWAMRPDLINELVRQTDSNADICIVEGVMGLFDGARAPGNTGRGSTADLATLLGWPIILVLDVSAQAETAAAIALGLHTYRAGTRLAGVILNCVGSPGHAAMVSQPIEALGIPVLGAVHRSPDVGFGERHLGLVQAAEMPDIDARIDGIARTVKAGIDLNRLIALARPVQMAQPTAALRRLPPPGQRIALAQDAAFSFIYPHVVDGWRKAGAEITTFSPLADEGPDANSDAVWLPGGYPELHAGVIAHASNFHRRMRDCASRGVAIHGECGGYMVLGAGIEAGGQRHAMLGLLGLESSFDTRRLHLGYRRVRPLSANPGADLLGHEFHYCTVISNPDQPFATVTDATGAPTGDLGARRGQVTGTFFHVIDVAN